jgi:hypothetical protein
MNRPGPSPKHRATPGSPANRSAKTMSMSAATSAPAIAGASKRASSSKNIRATTTSMPLPSTGMPCRAITSSCAWRMCSIPWHASPGSYAPVSRTRCARRHSLHPKLLRRPLARSCADARAPRRAVPAATRITLPRPAPRPLPKRGAHRAGKGSPGDRTESKKPFDILLTDSIPPSFAASQPQSDRLGGKSGRYRQTGPIRLGHASGLHELIDSAVFMS